MKMKKRITIGLLLLTLVIALTGCGVSKKKEQDARELIAKMIEAADGAVVSQSDCASELDALMTFGAKERNWFWKFETHNEYDKESGRVNAEVVNYKNDEAFTTRFHMTEEQGVFYIYGKQGDTSWVKYDSCFLKEDMSRNFVSDMNLENAEIIDFKKNAKEIDGKKVHKLSVKLKDASIRELLFETGFKRIFYGSEYNSVDLSDITVQADYYVDVDTNQVVKLETQLDGMKNFMRDLVIYNDNLSYEEEYTDAKVQKCVLVYDNISYEDIKVPMLSFEEKQSSLLVYQEDTPYNLKVMEAEAEVICPKGWMVTEKGEHLIRISRFDNQVHINYMFYFPATNEEIEESISGEVESFKEQENYVSDKKGPKMGEFETYEVSLREGIVAYAYTPVKRAVFLVCVVDGTSSRLDKTLPEILETVKYEEIKW